MIKNERSQTFNAEPQSYQKRGLLNDSPQSSVDSSDLKAVSLENIFTDVIYNDLGFIKDDKLMVLVEEITLQILIEILPCTFIVVLIHSNICTYRDIFLLKSMERCPFCHGRSELEEKYTSISASGNRDLLSYKIYAVVILRSHS